MDTLIEMSEDDISTQELSQEELLKEYNTLKELLNSTKIDLDHLEQRKYDQQREISKISALEQEYIQEIEALQENAQTETKKRQAERRELQEKRATIAENNRKCIVRLKAEYATKKEQLCELQFEKEDESPSGIREAANNRLIGENSTLKEEISLLGCANDDLQMKLDVINHSNDQLKAKFENSKLSFDSLQENYLVKVAELREAKLLRDTTQDEIIELRSEIELLKCTAMDSDSPGNSIFSEVNSNRVELQEIMSETKAKYMEMKQGHSGLLNQIDTLKHEKLMLSKLWKEDVQQCQSAQRSLLEMHKSQITLMELLVTEWEKLAEDGQHHPEKETSLGDLFDDMFDRKEKHINKLSEEMKRHYIMHSILSTQIHKSKVELLEWKSKYERLSQEQTRLKLEIEHPEIKKPMEMGSNDTTNIVKRPVKFAIVGQREVLNSKNPKPQKTNKVVQIDLKKLLCKVEEPVLKMEEKGEEKQCHLMDTELPAFNSLNGSELKSDAVSQRSKENHKQKKCITFSEDTVFVDAQDRKKCRRPGKILTCPQVHIPSHRSNES